MGEEAKRSGVEVTKENSRALRGTIADTLASSAEKFGDADKNLIKFHGTYQQEDRDARKARRGEGLGKYHMFMVRCKIPAGRVTAEQYLALDDLAGRHANGTLRVTSRQGIQFHGVLMRGLKETIAGINATLLTTLGACGDVNRNVMACPAPLPGPRSEMQALADEIAAHLAPRTRAYHEIWLDGQPTEMSGQDDEPIYGKVYLPRKFKVGIGLPEDNCVDVYSQDLGFLAAVEGGRVVGYDLMAGGGMGKTHGNASTFPYLARPVCFVAPSEAVAAAEALVRLFRDHGNRADRKRARLKYVVHDWGIERFREVYAEYLGRPLVPPRGLSVTGLDLHLGAHPMGGGKWWYGLSILSGRIKDDGPMRLRTGLRAIVDRFRPEVRLTPMQDLLLCGLSIEEVYEVEGLLGLHGIPRPEASSPTRRESLACPAVPTCGLAISEAERTLPAVLDELEARLSELGLANERIGVRVTGCPNGCVRPYQSDIGIVGRSGDRYVVYVGGRVQGDRLNFELRDLTPRGEIVATLTPLLRRFRDERLPGEGLGDFCTRLGPEACRRVTGCGEPGASAAGG
jgi:sulfite reductase (ferredoxin)